ncbi:protein unc-45, partial [Tremellales sp. Uapishka_1]
MTSEGDRPEERLKKLLKSLALPSPTLPTLRVEDVQLVAASLLPAAPRPVRSLAYLSLSKFCESVDRGATLSADEKTAHIAETFEPFLESTFASESEDYLPLTVLLASLFPLSPPAAIRLLASDTLSPTPLEILLEAAELTSPLQPALADLLSQAASTKAGRAAVRAQPQCTEWLQGGLDYDNDRELGSLCAVALSKLAQRDEADMDPQSAEDGGRLCQKMMDLIEHSPASSPAILATLQGLALLSLRSHVKHLLASSPDFLKSLVDLSPSIKNQPGSLPVTPRGSLSFDAESIETAICYPIITILENLTAPKPTLSADDQQIAKLRAMALKSAPVDPNEEQDDPLESKGEVEKRTLSVILAGGIGALKGLARGESRLVKETLGKLCLNLVENQKYRLRFVRDGGFKVLSGVVRDLSVRKDDDGFVPSLPAFQALAKMIITTPPQLLFPPPHTSTALNALTPLYLLLLHPSSTLLQQFEALMALTNLATVSPEIASRIVTAEIPSLEKSGWQGMSTTPKSSTRVMGKIEELLLEDNTLVRRASTELICNLVNSSAGFACFSDPGTNGKSRLHVLLILTAEEDLQTRLAASGALAVLVDAGPVCDILLEGVNGRSVWERIGWLFDPEDALHDLEEVDGERIKEVSSTPPNDGLVHRGLVTLLGLLAHGKGLDEARREGIEDRLREIKAKGGELAGLAQEALGLLTR